MNDPELESPQKHVFRISNEFSKLGICHKIYKNMLYCFTYLIWLTSLLSKLKQNTKN